MKRILLIATSALCLAGCTTINGVPQSPCQRTERAATLAHDAVRLAVDAGAGADIVVIGKLNTAADAADAIAAGICAARPTPATPGV